MLAALHRKHGAIFRLRFPGVRHHQIWTDDPHCVKHLLNMVGQGEGTGAGTGTGTEEGAGAVELYIKVHFAM